MEITQEDELLDFGILNEAVLSIPIVKTFK